MFLLYLNRHMIPKDLYLIRIFSIGNVFTDPSAPARSTCQEQVLGLMRRVAMFLLVQDCARILDVIGFGVGDVLGGGAALVEPVGTSVSGAGVAVALALTS